jgi:L-threonylcarbamoyladenylate synthase
MKMIVIKLSDKNIKEDDLIIVKHILDEGGIIAFPTETSYALGVDPFNANAVDKVFYFKKRVPYKPLLLIIAEVNDVEKYAVELPSVFYPLAKNLWPGPLTMVMKVRDIFPLNVRGGGDKLGFRVSSSIIARKISRCCGYPVTATSSNISGKGDCVKAEEVIKAFNQKLDLVVDGGAAPGGYSTVIDITCKPPKVIRIGLISEQTITEVLKS